MDTLKKIAGTDRFLLVSTALIFFDIPQVALYASGIFGLNAWLWGILGAFIYGFIVNAAFNVGLFEPRMGLRVLVHFLSRPFQS